jgi:hypothetical protein
MSTGFRISMSRSKGIGLVVLLAVALVGCAQEPGQSAEPSSVAPSVAESTAPSAAPVGQFLLIDADTVLGPTNLTADEKPTKTCVQASRFAHNEDIVWRVKVFDPLTGEPMDDTMIESLTVVMPDQTLDLHYGPHPRDKPLGYFWTTSWVVPEGYPEGVINYTIEATANDGRTGSWEQFEVAAANLTVTAEVRPIIAE